MVRTRATSSATTDGDIPTVDAHNPIAPPPSQTSAGVNRSHAPANRSTTQDRPAYEDVRSPYYISSADHPGLALATPVLTDRNFHPWKRDFKLSIGARNKTPFLDGTLLQPPPEDPLLTSWLRCNQMVMSWILHSVSPEIKSSIMYLETAAAMWTELNNRFNQGNGPRIFELNESLIYLHQGEDSVSTYFTKLTAIWDEINQLRPRIPCTCAAATQRQAQINHDQVLQFLTGLNESFHSVRAQILLYDPWPPLNKVFSMIVHQERQRSLGNRPNLLVAAATTQKTSTHSPKIHPDPAANLASKNKKMRPMCTHCHKPGHFKDKCYFLHGFPPGYGNRKPQESSTKKPDNNKTLPHASQVSESSIDLHPSQLTNDQCQQLISMLAQQIQSTPSTSNNTPASTNFSGVFSDIEDWDC
ncbi:hypothetical protein CsatA_022505 [Cannabis sativa]